MRWFKITDFGLLLPVLVLLAACQSAPQDSAIGASGGPQQLLITFSQSEGRENSLLNALGSSYHRGDYGSSLHTRRQISGVSRDYALRETSGWVIDALGVYCGLFTLDPGTDVEALLRRLDADSRVESAQLLYHYSTRAEVVYNDPYFELQYGRATPFILDLHRHGTGKGITIAVIDTGVDSRHPDLVDQISESEEFLLERERQDVHDIHGTAVAGIIAARANNSNGIVGIAPDARILALKACRQLRRESSLARCTSYTLAQALSFAINRRAEIINLSLSGPYDPLLARLVQAALARGMIVTAADPGVGDERYPARLPGVIAVRETTTGTVPQAADSLEVRAPRGEVLSTGPGGGYDFYSGSSVATAIVSGLTALLVQQDAAMSAARRVTWLNAAMQREIGAAPLANTGHPLAGVIEESLPGKPQRPDF